MIEEGEDVIMTFMGCIRHFYVGNYIINTLNKDNISEELFYDRLIEEIRKIQFIEDIEDLDTDITRAVPVGLIVNEAITNSLKHAFSQDSASPVITVRLAKQFDTVSLKIRDNGPGFPEGKKSNDRALGLSLIESLTDQLDGKLHLLSENGAIVKIVFPI